MEKLKVEAIRIQNDYKNQDDFIEAINKHLERKGLSIRTYQTRISGKTKWKIDELNAISVLCDIPMDMIAF